MKLIKMRLVKITMAKFKFHEFVDKATTLLMFLMPISIIVSSILYVFCKIEWLKCLTDVACAFLVKIDTFATISTVLVGVYLTLITIVLTLDGNSLLAQLSKKNLVKLVNMISSAFFMSVIYMFSPLISPKTHFTFIVFGTILISYFMVMFFLSMKIGNYFIMIIGTDIDTKLTNIKKNSNENARTRKQIKKMYDREFQKNIF